MWLLNAGYLFHPPELASIARWFQNRRKRSRNIQKEFSTLTYDVFKTDVEKVLEKPIAWIHDGYATALPL